MRQDDRVCPHCSVDIFKVLEGRDYVAKLIAALSHPEPTTTVRAAWILGKLRARQAAEPLLHLISGDADVFAKAAAMEALGQIGDPRAKLVLAEFAEHGPATLRRTAAEALRVLDSATGCEPGDLNE